MPKKCSKALKKRVFSYTNSIFESSVREVLGLIDESKEDLETAMNFIREAQRAAKYPMHAYDELELKEMIEAQEKVSALYLEKIKQLPTKHLSEIIKAHELDGGLRRASHTIETILSELASRSILNDSNESDFISNDGDVDESTRKSKRSSKKTLSKRRKATKS
jgi:hypothetical protein